MKSRLEAESGASLPGTAATILEQKGRRVHAIGPDASVYEAVVKMAEHEVGALFVMDDARLVGVISERDYARKVILQGRSSRGTRVREVMTSPVIYVELTTPLADCMRIVSHEHVRHLPVLEQGRMIGVISIGDLVQSIVAHQAETIEQLSTLLTGPYPA